MSILDIMTPYDDVVMISLISGFMSYAMLANLEMFDMLFSATYVADRLLYSILYVAKYHARVST